VDQDHRQFSRALRSRSHPLKIAHITSCDHERTGTSYSSSRRKVGFASVDNAGYEAREIELRSLKASRPSLTQMNTGPETTRPSCERSGLRAKKSIPIDGASRAMSLVIACKPKREVDGRATQLGESTDIKDFNHEQSVTSQLIVREKFAI